MRHKGTINYRGMLRDINFTAPLGYDISQRDFCNEILLTHVDTHADRIFLNSRIIRSNGSEARQQAA